jgi:hypothetical protein
MINVIVATCFVVFIGLGNFLCSIMQPRYAIHFDQGDENIGRSLLKISFARRVDHSKRRTLFCFGFRSATIGVNRGLGPLLHALVFYSF